MFRIIFRVENKVENILKSSAVKYPVLKPIFASLLKYPIPFYSICCTYSAS